MESYSAHNMRLNNFLKVVVVGSLLFPSLVLGQVKPPNFSPDRLPDTGFTCEDKVTGGYYADVEADCQLFHVCVQVSDYEFQDFHFLCPNDTVFDQQHLVCTNWFEVDCHAQLALVPLQFFSNDFGIRSTLEDEDVRPKQQEEQLGSHNFLGQSHLRNTGRGQVEVGRRQQGSSFNTNTGSFNNKFNFDIDEDVNSRPVVRPAITGTPIPLGFTTTIRPIGQSGNIGGHLSGRNLKKFTSINSAETVEQEEEEDEEDEDGFQPTEPTVHRSFPKFARDGRAPKVKSNLKARLANSGHRKQSSGGFSKWENSFEKKSSSKFNEARRRKKISHEVEEKPQFKPRTFSDEAEDEFDGPEVRPDGRAARVKADLLAEIQNKQSESSPTTLEPFEEEFFASPSSPRPFVFHGSPSPFNALTPDPFGFSSTVAPFFLPTAKSVDNTDKFDDLDQTSIRPTNEAPAFDDETTEVDEEDNTDEPVNLRNGNRRVVNRFNRNRGISSPRQSPFQQAEKSDIAIPQLKFNIRQRQRTLSRTPVNSGNDNEVEESSSDECDDPFNCRPTVIPAAPISRHRPRVKSNIRAKKRNFWHKSSGEVGGGFVSQERGAGIRSSNNRKFRRGRKQRVQTKADESDNDNESEEIDETTEEENSFETTNEPVTQFIPTAITESVTETPAREKSKMEDIFEDVFTAQEDDLIVASSTANPVVFKGSPTPSFGFFSSPSPGFQHVGPHRLRPSFSNIGKDVNLGPKKFSKKVPSPNEFVFVTSTESNKIFIGTEEKAEMEEMKETTVAPAPKVISKEDKKQFPSFPIRGKFPFRTNQSFGTTTVSTTTEKEMEETKRMEEESTDTPMETTIAEVRTEPSNIPTDSAANVEQNTTPIVPVTRFSAFNRAAPLRNSKTFFNRKQLDAIKSTITASAQAAASKAAEDTNDNIEEVDTTEPTQTEEVSDPIRGRFPFRGQLSSFRKPAPRFNVGGLGSNSRPRRPNTFFSKLPVTPFTTTTTTEAPVVVTEETKNEEPFEDFFDEAQDLFVASSTVSSVVFKGSPTPSFGFFSSPSPNFGPSGPYTGSNSRPSFSNIGNLINLGPQKKPEFVGEVDEKFNGPTSNVLSVESELFDDTENELVPVDEESLEIKEARKRFRKGPTVKKAESSPPNANIRVEFTKAIEEEVEEDSSPRKFFVKPDGRKPRVKSNIRAKIAHRGTYPFGKQQGRHTQLEDLVLTGEQDQFEETDNTEKREINAKDAPTNNVVDDYIKSAYEELENEIVDDLVTVPARDYDRQHLAYSAAAPLDVHAGENSPHQTAEVVHKEPVQPVVSPLPAVTGPAQQPAPENNHMGDLLKQMFVQQQPATGNADSSNIRSDAFSPSPVDLFSPSSPSVFSRPLAASDSSPKDDYLQPAAVVLPPVSLSAFKALLQQTEKSQFPLQLLNTRNIAPPAPPAPSAPSTTTADNTRKSAQLV